MRKLLLVILTILLPFFFEMPLIHATGLCGGEDAVVCTERMHMTDDMGEMSMDASDTATILASWRQEPRGMDCLSAITTVGITSHAVAPDTTPTTAPATFVAFDHTQAQTPRRLGLARSLDPPPSGSSYPQLVGIIKNLR